ncbi:DUF4397 domain-containing protein [Aliikangiella maris]|uniref:DUF4397 domain-containing protein n=2 Tax=Aliikangiella maris TaxID=3162458 RepID=A0ABV2BSD6_9GAMM
MKKLTQKLVNALALLAIIGLTACSSDNDSVKQNEQPSPSTRLQIVHASPDAPLVNILADDSVVAENVDYLQATPYNSITVGSHTLAVKALLADETQIDAFAPVSVDLAAETIYTVLAVNNVAAIEPLVLTRPDTGVTTGKVRLQLVHAAANAPMVDIYLTTPGADLTQQSPLVTAEFKQSLDATEIDPGEYQVRITPAGDAQTIVYDSGSKMLNAGGDYLVAAVTNVGPGSHPVNLIAVNPQGQTLPWLHSETPAAVRVVHASPDAPAVDVVANDNFDAPLIENLAYTEFAGYVMLPAADYNIKVTPTGAQAPVVIDADLSLMAGESYNVIAANVLASIEPLVLTADNRRIATEAKLRLVHASPAAGNVDIYIVAPGADITDLTPALSDVALTADSGFVSLLPGDYDVILTVAGSKDIALGPVSVTLNGAGIYTAIARDAAGGGLPAGLILLDDFL